MYKGGGGEVCAVVGCLNNRRKLHVWKKAMCETHGIIHEDCPCCIPFSLHKLPSNEELKREWMAAIRREDLPKNVFVCSEHFIDCRPTKQNPVPRINLADMYTHRTVSRGGRRCVAGGCSNTTYNGVSMHNFPGKRPNIHRQWVAFVRRKRKDWKPTRYSVLCSAHFEEDCFPMKFRLGLFESSGKAVKKILKEDAVPTILNTARTTTMPTPGKRALNPKTDLETRKTVKRPRSAFVKRDIQRMIRDYEECKPEETLCPQTPTHSEEDLSQSMEVTIDSEEPKTKCVASQKSLSRPPLTSHYTPTRSKGKDEACNNTPVKMGLRSIKGKRNDVQDSDQGYSMQIETLSSIDTHSETRSITTPVPVYLVKYFPQHDPPSMMYVKCNTPICYPVNQERAGVECIDSFRNTHQDFVDNVSIKMEPSSPPPITQQDIACNVSIKTEPTTPPLITQQDIACNVSIKTEPTTPPLIIQQDIACNVSIKTEPTTPPPITQQDIACNVSIKTEPTTSPPISQQDIACNVSIKTEPTTSPPITQQDITCNVSIKTESISEPPTMCTESKSKSPTMYTESKSKSPTMYTGSISKPPTLYTVSLLK